MNYLKLCEFLFNLGLGKELVYGKNNVFYRIIAELANILEIAL
jgi:hypothetical protein